MTNPRERRTGQPIARRIVLGRGVRTAVVYMARRVRTAVVYSCLAGAACSHDHATPADPALRGVHALPPLEVTLPSPRPQLRSYRPLHPRPVRIYPGFVPDPMRRTGQTGGGRASAEHIDMRCPGFISVHPDFLIEAARPFAELNLRLDAEAKVGLILVERGRGHHCAAAARPAPSSGSPAWSASLRLPLRAGTHRVWVATETPGQQAPYTLLVSELTGR